MVGCNRLHGSLVEQILGCLSNLLFIVDYHAFYTLSSGRLKKMVDLRVFILSIPHTRQHVTLTPQSTLFLRYSTISHERHRL
jgi:hypothetical protein